jgi:hypothetical protein
MIWVNDNIREQTRVTVAGLCPEMARAQACLSPRPGRSRDDANRRGVGM